MLAQGDVRFCVNSNISKLQSSFVVRNENGSELHPQFVACVPKLKQIVADALHGDTQSWIQ